MAHIFKDKIFVFIGAPKRCDRQAVRDALIKVDDIPDDRITAFTNYVVTFNHDGKTKAYQKAIEYDQKGLLTLLDEDEFFDILEGKSNPPEKPEQNEDIIIIPAKDPESDSRKLEKIEKDIKNRKRMDNLAIHGVSTPDGNIMKIDFRPLNTALRVTEAMKENVKRELNKFSVTIPTLESHNHIIGDIERGIKTYHRGGISFEAQREANDYWAHVPHKSNDFKAVTITFTRDGQDIENHSCDCSWRSGGNPVCRHVVAAVLAIQGGIVETTIILGKTAVATTVVDKTNTACAVGSGSLDIFATPMMIALMERASCEVLADALDEGQTSVGTYISVNHTAASPVGAHITAKATITSVRGRKIEFTITANDGKSEIGIGKHTRIIVDEIRFMEKVRKEI